MPMCRYDRPAAPSLGTKAEVKNLNSFRFLQQALEYEIERQIGIVAGGGRVVQETRLWDPSSAETMSMRSKEEAHDYRYFPEPDLPPLVVDHARVMAVAAAMPAELPDARRQRFVVGVRAARLRCRAADAVARRGRLLRGGGSGGRGRQARQQLDDGRADARAQQRGTRYHRVARAARPAGGAPRRSSTTAPSAGRSRSTSSRRCSIPAAAPPTS